MKQEEIYRRAVKHWGTNLQIRMACEEMAELSVVLLKTIRSGDLSLLDNVYEEIADVEIMLGQMREVYPHVEKNVQRWKRIKKYRLSKMLEEAEVEEATEDILEGVEL